MNSTDFCRRLVSSIDLWYFVPLGNFLSNFLPHYVSSIDIGAIKTKNNGPF